MVGSKRPMVSEPERVSYSLNVLPESNHDLVDGGRP